MAKEEVNLHRGLGDSHQPSVDPGVSVAVQCPWQAEMAKSLMLHFA